MLERGEPLDARFVDERFEFRPIGITWLQAATAAAARSRRLGRDRDLPAAVAASPAVLAVLAVWWLLGPLLGARGAR